jgi:hypothetical protein
MGPPTVPLRPAPDFVGRPVYIWERRRLKRTIELSTLDDAGRPDAILATMLGRGRELMARTAAAEWELKRRRAGLWRRCCEVSAAGSGVPAVTCGWDAPKGAIEIAGRGGCRWAPDEYDDRLWAIVDPADEVVLRFNDIAETGASRAQGLVRITPAALAVGGALPALILACALALQNGLPDRVNRRLKGLDRSGP